MGRVQLSGAPVRRRRGRRAGGPGRYESDRLPHDFYGKSWEQ